MADDLARLLAETYRWQRRLGNQVIATPHCSIVANGESYSDVILRLGTAD
jgi:hypothetical protein